MLGFQYQGLWIVMSGAGDDRTWYIHQEPNDHQPLNQAVLPTSFAAEHYVDEVNKINAEVFPKW